MVKVVYNRCFGGFGLSDEALKRLIELGCTEVETDGGYYHLPCDFPRHHPLLVKVVEELGEKANGDFANLKIATIEDNRYIINEYDGQESVQTPDYINWVIVDDQEIKEQQAKADVYSANTLAEYLTDCGIKYTTIGLGACDNSPVYYVYVKNTKTKAIKDFNTTDWGGIGIKFIKTGKISPA